jgi:hypothetical protein
VHEVVDYVINAGLYCVLNVHHDTGAHDNAWVIADNDNYEKTKARYENLWTQIAKEFKDYDQHLLFEGYNEMLDKYNSWCFAGFQRPNGYNADEAASAYKGLNGYAQSFVDAVRATGGNNTQRNLVINTYAAANGNGNWNAHLTDVLTELATPSDVTKNHLAYEVHAYPTLNNGKNEVNDIIDKVNTYLLPKGPVILGEWGTSNVDKAQTDYDLAPKTFLEFCKYMVQKAKENNIATFYWMGLSDGINRTLPAFNQPDLAECLAKAYHGSDFKGIYPTVDDFQIVYVVKWEKDWSELFLYGNWNTVTPLKLEDYKAVRVEVDEVPAAGSLQVKVYGDPDGKNADGSAKFKEGYYELSSDSKTTTVTFDQSKTGSVVSRLTLQTNIGATQAKITKAVLIKSDDTEVELAPTVAWGCSMTTESTPKPTAIQSVKAIASETDGAIYNLSGQRVSSPSKGIYIQNGKKIIIK